MWDERVGVVTGGNSRVACHGGMIHMGLHNNECGDLEVFMGGWLGEAPSATIQKRDQWKQPS